MQALGGIRARPELDCQGQELIEWLNENIRPNGKWSNNRVIIFTEYRATQNWLQTILATEGLHRQRPPADDVRRHGLRRAGSGQGRLPDRSRATAPSAFCWPPMPPPKGIDLQNHCCRLIHYEIPWNPNRHGAAERPHRPPRPEGTSEVLVYHFVGKGYKEREKLDMRRAGRRAGGDLEFLMRAVRKVEAIREDLGKVGPVIAEQVEEAMLGRRSRLDTDAGREGCRAGAQDAQDRAGLCGTDQAASGPA